MPLKKLASRAEQSEERRLRFAARRKAMDVFGKSAVLGKEVHHKNGNNQDNSKGNLCLKVPGTHGSSHGRGHGKRGKLNIKNGS